MSEGGREREALRLYYICPLKWLYNTGVHIYIFCFIEHAQLFQLK